MAFLLAHSNFLSVISSGSLLDHTERKSAPYLLYSIQLLYALILGVTIYGSLMLLSFDCDFSGSPWNLVQFARAAVAFHWTAVAASLIACFVAFNPFPDHGDLETWLVRCSCLFCCVSTSTEASSAESRSQISSSGETISSGGIPLMYHPFPGGPPQPEDTRVPGQAVSMERGSTAAGGPRGVSNARHQSKKGGSRLIMSRLIHM